MGEMRNAFKVLIAKYVGKGQFCRWKYNLKICIGEGVILGPTGGLL
jgi:hypothetical protein